MSLPIPDNESKRLSDALSALIKNHIRKNGAIPFSQFMELALYAPGLGYYRNSLKKFGRDGDFITAPELSPLFSDCVANQCAQVLSALKHGDIFEFGAGSGVMAADILLSLSEKNQLPDHYYILEISGFLKSVQRDTIEKKAPHCLDRVVWLDALPEKTIEGVVLANEVLDAMPVSQFVWQDGVRESGVALKDDELVSCVLENENTALTDAIRQYDIAFENGYLSEVNLYLPGWVASIGKLLSRGLVLMMDYGYPRATYYHPDRSMGTLMAHYRHRAHSDVLLYPGIQDITAHVDFTAVAESAVENGFDVVGFTHQAAFLMNCGLLNVVEASVDEKTRFMRNQQILQLTLPSEMGELFKVIGLAKNIDIEVMGFQTMNQLSRL